MSAGQSTRITKDVLTIEDLEDLEDLPTEHSYLKDLPRGPTHRKNLPRGPTDSADREDLPSAIATGSLY